MSENHPTSDEKKPRKLDYYVPRPDPAEYSRTSSLSASSSRGRSFALSLTMLCAFMIVVIAAGHGIGCIGGMLFLGEWDEWWLLTLSTLLSVILFFTAPLLYGNRNLYLGWNFAGSILMLMTWAGFAGRSDEAWSTGCSSLPFLGLLIAKLVCDVVWTLEKKR